MAYSELIKNFDKIRDYMREFYIYGFKSRDEYTQKSARSYDDEKRRVESWLGDYMGFRQTPAGKQVFISIDSRMAGSNPLFKAWKAKSFTDGDITLHFLLMDLLTDDCRYTISEIMDRLYDYRTGMEFDESTVRKKLKEYISEGIVVFHKQGRIVQYSRAQLSELPDTDILDFFSEAAMPGVPGSFLLDKTAKHTSPFTYKHHYITGVLDSGIVYEVLKAMHKKAEITLHVRGRKRTQSREIHVVPLKIMESVQGGRRYIMGYDVTDRCISSYRIDRIDGVKIGEIREDYEELSGIYEAVKRHIWGVSTKSRSGERMGHVEFTVRYADDEKHILKRLEREKRVGSVEIIDSNSARFTADICDLSEIIPWIRTFICRITHIEFSDKTLEAQFKNDIDEMYAMYGIEEEV